MSQLRAFVERIERLEEEISTLNADKSEVYKEAKATGFDVKVLRKVIAARRMDRSERQEAETLFDLYMAELEGSVRARVEKIEKFQPVATDQHADANAGSSRTTDMRETDRKASGSEDAVVTAGEAAQIPHSSLHPSRATSNAGTVPPPAVPAPIR